MITYKIHIIRTGRTNAKQGKRYVGQLDVPLCDEGISELERTVKECRYPQVEMVFTSPLSRCVKTAGILYPDTYCEELDGLKDMKLGDFEGKSFEQLRGNEDFSRWISNSVENAPPDGEALEDFMSRIIATIHGIFKRMMDEKITSVALVTHGGVIMTLLSAICLPKMPINAWAVDNGYGYTLLFTPQMWMRDGAAEVYARIPEASGQ